MTALKFGAVFFFLRKMICLSFYILQIDICVIKSDRTIHPIHPINEQGEVHMDRKKVAGLRAWEVRKMKQDKLLGEIQQRIDSMEKFFAGVSLHRFILSLIDRELAVPNGGTGLNCLPDVHLTYRSRVSQIFQEVLKEIREFQGGEAEGNYLLEELFMWAASKMGQQHREQYAAQEEEMLRQIYGVEHASDTVPSE